MASASTSAASTVRASRLLAIQTPSSPSKSAAFQLLKANAFTQQAATGMHCLLPLGQRVIARLIRLIERELDAVGAQKLEIPVVLRTKQLQISMPFLGAKELWEKTGRWDSMGAELLRFADRNKKEFCLQPTAEEMVTSLLASHSSPPVSAYPFMLYQTTPKYRDEMNPRFGLLRGREFVMNDLYSFDIDEEGARQSYEAVSAAYDTILRGRLGLEVYKVRADSGVHGGSLSHEYHMRNGLQEDAMEACTSCGTHYKADEPSSSEPCCDGARRERISSIEIAHTFQLGTRYSEVLNAYSGSSETKAPLHMCCFGIGVTRLLPAIVEWLARPSCIPQKDWCIHLPRPIAPFDVAVVPSTSLLSSLLVGTVSSAVDAALFSRDACPEPAILLDDRTRLSMGRRVQAAQSMGISRVVVLGKGTEKTAETDPQYELWTADPLKSEKLTKRGDYGLTALVQALQEN